MWHCIHIWPIKTIQLTKVKKKIHWEKKEGQISSQLTNQNSPHYHFLVQLRGQPPIDESRDYNSLNWNQLEYYYQLANGRAPHQQTIQLEAIAFAHKLYMLINTCSEKNLRWICQEISLYILVNKYCKRNFIAHRLYVNKYVFKKELVFAKKFRCTYWFKRSYSHLSTKICESMKRTNLTKESFKSISINFNKIASFICG